MDPLRLRGRQAPSPSLAIPPSLHNPKRNPFKIVWGLKPEWEGLVPHRVLALLGQCAKIRLVLFVFVGFFCFVLFFCFVFFS